MIYILKRNLADEERRYIMGMRSVERIKDMYQTMYMANADDIKNYTIPLMNAEEFLITYYQQNDLWIKK